MNKNILSNFILSATSLVLLSACSSQPDINVNKKYYNIVEFDIKKNFMIVDYRTDKISYDVFEKKANEVCLKQNKIVSFNSSKEVGHNIERVSFSCVVR